MWKIDGEKWERVWIRFSKDEKQTQGIMGEALIQVLTEGGYSGSKAKKENQNKRSEDRFHCSKTHSPGSSSPTESCVASGDV